MLDFHRVNYPQRLLIFKAIDHLLKAHQSCSLDACFVCNDDLSDCCSIESWRRPRCAAKERFGCLSFPILIIDDALHQDDQPEFEEPMCQAYRYQSIQF